MNKIKLVLTEEIDGKVVEDNTQEVYITTPDAIAILTHNKQYYQILGGLMEYAGQQFFKDQDKETLLD